MFLVYIQIIDVSHRIQNDPKVVKITKSFYLDYFKAILVQFSNFLVSMIYHGVRRQINYLFWHTCRKEILQFCQCHKNPENSISAVLYYFCILFLGMYRYEFLSSGRSRNSISSSGPELIVLSYIYVTCFLLCIDCLTEISKYFSAPTIPRDSEPLDWWRAQNEYPSLKKVAKKFLTSPLPFYFFTII